MTRRVEALIRRLELRPHPEGGWYRETYRSRACTAILYLLAKGGRSRLHRIRHDELWHFHAGDTLVVAEIGGDGRPRLTTLGSDVAKGQAVQYCVPGGTWFGAYLPPRAEFALVGCTVAPAFRFEDFSLGDRGRLLRRYPRARALIRRLSD